MPALQYKAISLVSYCGALLLAAVACKESGFGGQSKSQAGSAASQASSAAEDGIAHAPDNPSRPRDEGEGVPGFELVPQLISVTLGEAEFAVAGKAGAIKASRMFSGKLILQIWLLDAVRYDSKTAQPVAGLAATLNPTDTGNFKFNHPGSGNFHVAVTLSQTATSILDRSEFSAGRVVAAIATAPGFGEMQPLAALPKTGSSALSPVFRFYDGADHSYSLSLTREKVQDKLELVAFVAFPSPFGNRPQLALCSDKTSRESTLSTATNCAANDDTQLLPAYLADPTLDEGTRPVFSCTLTTDGAIVDRFVTMTREECVTAGYQEISELGFAK
jgi:hypothetical protein